MAVLPADRGALVAVAGASTGAKTEFVTALVRRLADRGREALVIGGRPGVDPEVGHDGLRRYDGRGLDDAIEVGRMAERSAVTISSVVITVRPVFDEFARYRAARALRHEYLRNHVAQWVEAAVGGGAGAGGLGYDLVLWLRSPLGDPSVGAFEAALGAVLIDLAVEYHALQPPVASSTIENLVASLCP